MIAAGGASQPAAKLHVHLDRKRIEIASETGVDSWRIDRVRRASKQYGRFWCLQFEDAARLLALVPMRPKTALMLWHLSSTLDSVAWTRVLQHEAAEALAFDRTQVSRALKELEQRAIIMQHPSRLGHYRMSLWLTWRGDASTYQKERRKREAEIEAGTEWHTARAISNVDSDDTVIRYWRFSDDLSHLQRAAFTHPPSMTAEEWALFCTMRPARTSKSRWWDHGAARPPKFDIEEWGSIGHDARAMREASQAQ